jgi:hypothetical protein
MFLNVSGSSRSDGKLATALDHCISQVNFAAPLHGTDVTWFNAWLSEMGGGNGDGNGDGDGDGDA